MNFSAESPAYVLDLTGPASHMLIRRPGVAHLTIAPKSFGEKADLHAEADEHINWQVLEQLGQTDTGDPWPCHLSYMGRDTGFFDWARTRPIQFLYWTPLLSADCRVDASAASIWNLALNMHLMDGHLHLCLPPRWKKGAGLWILQVAGDLSRLTCVGQAPNHVELCPALGPPGQAPYQLPDVGLHAMTGLSIYGDALGRPVSLDFLVRFPKLNALMLSGNFCDFEHLSGLKQIKSLRIYDMPDLTGFPDLSVFPKLSCFSATTVNETGGRRLRRQFKALAALRAWEPSSGIYRLRPSAWWASEYGHPFADWPIKRKKNVFAAYHAAQTALQQVVDANGAKAALVAFITRLEPYSNANLLAMEDVEDAYWRLAQLPRVAELGITQAEMQEWLDEALGD